MKSSFVDILKQMTVLYADDDPVILDATSATLSMFFAHVITAKNGKIALDKFNDNHIDIVILDVKMPKLGGLEVAEAIRENDKKTPIFLLSNYTEVEDLKKAVTLDLVAYLTKPLSYDELIETLKNCIKRLSNSGTIKQKLTDSSFYNYIDKTIHTTDETIRLTKSESILLETLSKRRGFLVNYDEIVRALGGNIGMHALHNLVFRLRKKIGKSMIEGVQDLGYVLR